MFIISVSDSPLDSYFQLNIQLTPDDIVEIMVMVIIKTVSRNVHQIIHNSFKKILT